MYAETEKEKDEWIGHIGRAIVRSSAGKSKGCPHGKVALRS